ncbi:uncharacterized protein CLUP02_00260 [Colletotrichum lupini]|uniref:Uncharacterized protein n=1 Tax=Colletotrichum lupini TaxID=145971 RepID=A0A9Q8SAQ2_9PEZI|nr:uncharacterized protein CLUP02_00260 [Colletotrichum lupini]UQC73615.1 hypothetical protein CLUP02_00260 [Colletotrichum lupini]
MEVVDRRNSETVTWERGCINRGYALGPLQRIDVGLYCPTASYPITNTVARRISGSYSSLESLQASPIMHLTSFG